MKRILVCGFGVLMIAAMVLMLASCAKVTETPGPIPPAQNMVAATATLPPLVILPSQEPMATVENPAEYTLVILGQDESVERCAKGQRCGQYSHSDVFVIVHVVMETRPKATVILLPRSLWVQDDGVDGFDGFSMVLYGWAGYDGVHAYVEHVFGLPVDGVIVVKMDRFVEIVNELGGLDVAGKNLAGDDVLLYLRDNVNNWGCDTYDCNGHIFEVAKAFRLKADMLSWEQFTDLLIGFNTLYDTDMSWDTLVGFSALYFRFEAAGGEVEFVRLWIPTLKTDDTPFDIRGLVPARPLTEWMAEVLGGS